MDFNFNIVRFFVIFSFIAINQAYAETVINTVNGRIDNSVIWTKDNSPYILNADVQVSFTGSLTIKEGVEIQGNGKRFKIANRLTIEGTAEENIIMSNVNIGVAGAYSKGVKISIKYANINPSPSFGGWSQIEFSRNGKYKSDGFILENSIINRAGVEGYQANNSVKIINNNFNKYSNFGCYDCNYESKNKGTFTATGNSFGMASSLRVSGQTRFKKIIISDNEFNQESNGLNLQPYEWDSWVRNTEEGKAQTYEILRNKFTKTNQGILAYLGKFVINDNVFIESPGINYRGNQAGHNFEIKNNFFSKVKNYAISNSKIWNGDGSKATITNNMFCSIGKPALSLSTDENSNIVAGQNYWNTTSKNTIKKHMIYDSGDDVNIKNSITFGRYSTARAPWLKSYQVEACNNDTFEEKTEAECSIGGIIYEDTVLDSTSCISYNMTSDYQIPKGLKLTVNPSVVINGNGRSIKVVGEVGINGAQGALVKLNNVNIRPAGYPDKIKISIKYANINPSPSFGGWSQIEFSRNGKYKSDGFILENSIINRAGVEGYQANNSVKIINNNFNKYSNFGCYDCNYESKNKGTFTATGNSFGMASSLRVSGQTRFKKIIISDNEFNQESNGLNLQPYEWDSWVRNTEEGKAQTYEILRNKFTKTNQGILAYLGKFVINDNVFIESPGINYRGNQAGHNFEIKNNFFSKVKNYAISNSKIWNGDGSKATITNNMFCSIGKPALSLSTDENSNIVAGQNYWNTTSKNTIKKHMIYDSGDDVNIKNSITFGRYSTARAPWLKSYQVEACNNDTFEEKTEAECSIGGIIYEDTVLDSTSCISYNMTSDYQIPKGLKLTVNPSVVINGNGRSIKVVGEVGINGAQGALVKLNNVNIRPAGYPDKIKISIKYANINPSPSFGGWSQIEFSRNGKYKSDGFILENSIINRAGVEGYQANNSVKIINNNFNKYSNFGCYDCNYESKNKGTFTATGNSFGMASSLRVSGQTRFKKIIISDNEFNQESNGLNLQPYEWDSWVRNTEEGKAQTYEILRNKFTKTNQGILAYLGKFVINDNVFIESPGINYRGNQAGHNFEIKNNTFCKQKNYAISNNKIWNGDRSKAIVKANNFCSVDRAAVQIGADSQSQMNAVGNYWNGASSSTIQRKMIWDRLDDINIYNHISWYPALSTPTGESLGGYSDKFGGTVLQSCLPDSSTNAGSICAVICEGLEIEGDAPEPVVDPGAEIPLTFPPAVIIPRSTPKGKDAILQAIFNIRVGHQWEGHLKKYTLKKDGSIGDLQWDAGDKLNTSKSASSRNIFTVGDGLSALGKNNFNINNFETLKPILYGDNHTNIDNEDAKKLINFVRGVDVFNEDKDESSVDERWKLGDTYHADLLVVGPPNARVTDNPNKANTDASYRYARGYHNFALSNKSRKSVVFAAANDGMLHAFDLESGEELWAFIPPMILPRLQLMQSATANQSTSIYGVDGSPVYKDVYLNGRWRTVVMGGLGMGGHGYYALDVTDIENPVHMFSFAYDPATQQGSVWRGQNGQKTLTSDFNKLGQAWSKPLMLRIPNYGWVAVFGGGFNNEISEYGSMAYIVDLENEGRLVKAISVYDTSNKLTNAVPASMTAITPDSSDKANYTGAMVYFADLEGKLWKLDLTDQGSMFAMEQVFDAEASHPNKTPPGNGRFTYFPVAPSIGSDGKLRLFYGTGDMQDLMDSNQNVDNRFYGIKEQDFSNPAEQGRTDRFTESSLIDVTNEADICSDEDDRGWKIKLKPTEKVTSKANVSYGTVTFSRYTPLTTESCELGKTSITGVDYQCGSEEFNIDLGIGITTVPTLYRGKLYIGISGDAINTFTPPEGWIKKDNLLMGEPGDLSNWQGVKMKSWKESF